MLKLQKQKQVTVKFEEIDDKEFCETIKNAKDLVNAVGHKATVDLINTMCSTQLKENRISIVANARDIIIALILTIRLEEGRVLKEDEIKQFLEQGKIKFVKAEVGE
jgi:lauroyl/myristoyl acyltransferase